jgi:hypothetical protein
MWSAESIYLMAGMFVSKKKKEHCALREQIRIEAAFWQFPLEG